MTTTTHTLHDCTLHHDSTGALSIARGHGKVAGLRAHAVVGVEGKEIRVDLLADAKATISVRGGRRTLALAKTHAGFSTRWMVTVDAADPWIDITVAVSTADRSIELREVSAFGAPWTGTHLAPDIAQARWWATPANAWEPPGTRPVAGAVHAEDCRTLAFDLGAAFAPSGAALTIAHILPTRWINRIDADADGVRVVTALRVPVPARGSLRTDALLLDIQRPALTTLADAAKKVRGRRAAVEASEHSGWSTWDFYTDKVVEQDVLDHLAFLGKHPKIADKLRYIVVDDFWQDKCGDWGPGARFGSIQNTAKAISAAGFLPGIWTAPFFADRDSELLRAHPDYAMHLTDGRLYAHCMGCDPPWGDRIFLDPTHPGVREHLTSLYRRLYGWGFRYFKTDFLADPVAHEFDGERMKWRGQLVFHDPQIGLVRGHRACMEAIRAAIGPDSFWLGCGSLFASGAGIMDATRISADMRVHYTNLLMCARSAIFNGNLHGGPFLADPDFSVFRGRDTVLPGGLELPPEGKKPYDRLKADTGPVFDLAESRLWAAVLAMSGGLVMLSDRLDRLNASGLAIVETLLDLCGGEPAIPADLFTPLPAVWTAERDGKPLALIANWADASAAVTVPNGSAIVDGTVMQDVWTGTAFTWRAGAAVTLPAHGHLLLRG